MTDFRNYTLLADVDNLSEVKLSRAKVNITNHDFVDYSDIVLTTAFTAGDNWFNNSLSSNFTFSIDTNLSQDYAVVINGIVADVDTTFVDTIILGNATIPGKYLFVENIQFSYSVDDTVLADIPFNISLNYSDYAGNDHTDSCTLLIDEVPSALTDINLSEGTHNWNISCSYPGMPAKDLSGTIVANTFLVEYPTVYRFVPFLVNVTYYNTTLCNLSLDDDTQAMDATGLETITVTDTAAHTLNVTCEQDSQVFAITAIDTRTTWDREEVISTEQMLPYKSIDGKFTIISPFRWGASNTFEDGYNYYNGSSASYLTRWTIENVFYFNGILNEQNVELTN